MDESNRHRRTRNRPPYDLRRRVLLKNFLREQMAPIPVSTFVDDEDEVVPVTSENEIVDNGNVDSTSDAMIVDTSNDAIDPQSNTEISSRMEIDDEDSTENTHFKTPLMRELTKITKLKLSQFNSLKRKTPSLSANDVKAIADKNSVHLKSKDKHRRSSKITSSALRKLRKMIAACRIAVKKSKTKNMSGEGIRLGDTRHRMEFSKFGSFNNSIRINAEKKVYDAGIPERVRMMKGITKRQFCRKYKIPYKDTCYSRSIKDPTSLLSRLLRWRALLPVRPDSPKRETSNLNEIRKLENSNKRLREENESFSASFSRIMADVDTAIGAPVQFSPYSPCSSNSNQEFNPCYDISGPPRHKRSRSVQDRRERRREIRSRLSSQSMCHQQYSRIPPRTLYRAKPCIINPFSSDEAPLPYPKSPPVQSASLDRSCAKFISRRSSMPERISRQPLVIRRSSFAYETNAHSRQNLLSLPTEAFY